LTLDPVEKGDEGVADQAYSVETTNSGPYRAELRVIHPPEAPEPCFPETTTYYHTIAIKAGHVICTGKKPRGQSKGADPALITNAVSVAAGWLHSCAVLATGEVLCWGINNQGQLSVPPDIQGQVVEVVAAVSGGDEAADDRGAEAEGAVARG
jgi:hypothetical protein